MAMLSQSNRARVCAFAENRIARPPATRKTQPRMSRPGNILSLGMLIAAALLALPQDHAAPRPAIPNFLQILTDDQGWGDLHCFGHPYIQSPNLDRLAAEGIKFTHCYAADSVCSPSRSAILTGRTPYRNGVYRWIPGRSFCFLSAREITLPQLLRQAGYQTAHFGKWHLSYYAERRIPGTHDYEDFVFGGEHADPPQPTLRDYGYDWWLATGNVARPNHQNPRNFFLNGRPVGETKGFSAQIVARYFVDWLQQ